ncbi:Hypothetical predicted protein [Podarcis lilfordi]|uniref:Uncharacterized protein n=1 Tax=Podarcis lilfordi TaxID=74358 RepID=A0AA35K1C2_9SAUR|nr:Hypothetical predicted protein [Podarcis lilfordi]
MREVAGRREGRPRPYMNPVNNLQGHFAALCDSVLRGLNSRCGWSFSLKCCITDKRWHSSYTAHQIIPLRVVIEYRY